MVMFSRQSADTRVEQLEKTVAALRQELLVVRRELHDRVSKNEAELFFRDHKEKMNNLLASAADLNLTKQEFADMVSRLADLQKRVQFIDPNIRDVFLELNHRIRVAEKLVERLDKKTQKTSFVFE